MSAEPISNHSLVGVALDVPAEHVAAQRLHWLPWLGLAMILLAIAGVRWRYLEVPLERDEGEFAYGGQMLLAGELPYVSFYAMKLPGIYVVYALIEVAFGQTIRGIHLGLLIVNLVSALLVFLLVRKLFDAATALLAASAFGILTFSPIVTGTLAQAEHFVLLPALAGALVVASANDAPRWFKYLGAGLLFGTSLVIKQHGALFLLFGLAAVVTCHPSQWRSAPGILFARLALMGLGGVLPLLIICGVMASLGAWQPFVFWTFTYPREYVREVPAAAAWANLKIALGLHTQWSTPIWFAAGVGLAAVWLPSDFRRRGWFLLLWLLASIAAIVPGYYFREHYFVFLTPSLAIYSAIALRVAWRGLARLTPCAGWIGAAFATSVIGWCAFEQVAFVWPMTPSELAYYYYRTVFRDAPTIARYIEEHSLPDDRIAILGSEPEMLFYARRRSATGHIYMYPLLEAQPHALEMQAEAIREIEAAKPRLFVVCELTDSWLNESAALLHRSDSVTPIFSWINEYVSTYYRPVGRAELFPDAPTRYFWTPEELAVPPKSTFTVYIYVRNDGPPIDTSSDPPGSDPVDRDPADSDPTDSDDPKS